MFAFSIYLKNYVGDHQRGDRPQEGWITAHGWALGHLVVSRDPSSALRFDSEDRAEELLLEAEAKFGLDREEAYIAHSLSGKTEACGELKYVNVATPSKTLQVVRELRDYLSIAGEPTSDWGHDFGFGLV